MVDIHNYGLSYKRELNYLEKRKISDANKKVIVCFYDACLLQGLSQPRLVKLLELCRCMAQLLKCDFETASIDELKTLVRTIE